MKMKFPFPETEKGFREPVEVLQYLLADLQTAMSAMRHTEPANRERVFDEQIALALNVAHRRLFDLYFRVPPPAA